MATMASLLKGITPIAKLPSGQLAMYGKATDNIALQASLGLLGTIAITAILFGLMSMTEQSLARQDRLNQEAHHWVCNGPHVSHCTLR